MLEFKKNIGCFIAQLVDHRSNTLRLLNDGMKLQSFVGNVVFKEALNNVQTR